MIYRVMALLNFTIDDEATDFYHDCQVALAKAVTINPDQPGAERSTISLHRCLHDEYPTSPCILIEEAQTP